MSILTPDKSGLTFEKFICIDELRGINPFGILTASEWEEYDHWKAISRKKQWLTGRYLGKSLVRDLLQDQSVPFNQIGILSRNSINQSVRPDIYINKTKSSWSLSISHTDTHAWAVLSNNPNSRIGIDLISDSLSNTRNLLQWFTDREKESLAGDFVEKIADNWSLKEAIYKAVNNGEGFSPLRIEILKSPDGTDDLFVNGKNITHLCHIEKKQFQNHSGVLVEILNS